eukprot:2852014-Rhodomonas_salina.1
MAPSLGPGAALCLRPQHLAPMAEHSHRTQVELMVVDVLSGDSNRTACLVRAADRYTNGRKDATILVSVVPAVVTSIE